METKQLSFRGELLLLEKKEKRRQAVELWLLNDEVTENGGRYVKLAEHKNGFVNTPILIAYVGDKIGDGHNFDEIIEPNGEVKASFMDAFAERIVGWFDADESKIRLEEKDGKNWIVGKGYISTWYAPELTEKLRRQGARGMSVSIETLVWNVKTEDGVDVYEDYEILGTTILGDDVPPAVVGANVTILNSIGAEQLKKMTIKVASADKKPHNKKSVKGENRMFDLKDLQAAFPAYKVLAAQDDRVIMLNGSNVVVVANTKQEDEKIVAENETEVSLNASYALDENSSIEVAVDDILKAAVETNASLKSALDEAEKAKEAAEKAKDAALSALSKMQEAEKERRLAEVKRGLETLAKDLEECYGKSVCSELLEKLTSAESLERYALMEDKDGRFCGLEAAKKDLDFAYNEERRKEAKINNNKFYAWDYAKSDDGEKDENALTKAVRNITK